MIAAKGGRLTQLYFRRYVKNCDFTLRNHSIILISSGRQICHLSQQQNFTHSHSLKSLFKRFSTESNSSDLSIPSVDYNEIKALPQHPEKMLIDVREPQELAETGTIPTSINIPLASVKQELADRMEPQAFQAKYSRQKPSAEDELIFTCKLGKRAHTAASIAKSMGFTNVKYYAGSWEDWAKHENK